MREAVNRFIEKTLDVAPLRCRVVGTRSGRPNSARRSLKESRFCHRPEGAEAVVNIVDLGEGHTPEAFPTPF